MKKLCSILLLLWLTASATGQGIIINTTTKPYKYGIGVYAKNDTVTIPRQRTDMGLGVSASYLSGNPGALPPYSLPGGELSGNTCFSTILKFPNTITGALIKTEGYGLSTTGGNWNHNNTSGDLSLKANLGSHCHDFGVDGSAVIRDGGYAYNEWWTAPDVTGPDFVLKADGLQAQGADFRAERLSFFSIPGAAMRLLGGNGSRSGSTGFYDDIVPRIDDISIHRCMYGIIQGMGDCKMTNIWIAGCIKDGLVLNSPTAVLNAHCWGMDRGCVINSTSELTQCYFEAARIGLQVSSGASGSRITGLNIGPATTFYRCIKIDTSGTDISGIIGTVRAPDATWTDIAGCEIASGVVHNRIQGSMVLNGDGAKGVILRGTSNEIDLIGGWNVTLSTGTYVEVLENPLRSKITIRGKGTGGIVLDLSTTTLDSIDGQGLEIDICWNGTPTTMVKYPGGGTDYNLTTGTTLRINGVLQEAP